MINYPIKKQARKLTNNLDNTINGMKKAKGMTFEDMLNSSNKYYREENIAIIYKKPTPIKILKVKSFKINYQNKHKIVDARFQEKSTTDYNGIYKGKYIDFEAKQTIYKSFNLASNLHSHQLDHLYKIKMHGGIAFLIIYFQKYDRIFLISIGNIKKFLDKVQKSQIPLQYFEEYGIEIEEGINPRIDYLKAVDLIL